LLDDADPPVLVAPSLALDETEPVVAVVEGLVPEPPASEPPSDADAALPSPLPASFAAPAAADDPADERASFFAQPLPLKTIAGALSAFFIAPPQTSHVSGPVPEIEWTTSTECPQDVQR
jgi:hypothetical protein